MEIRFQSLFTYIFVLCSVHRKRLLIVCGSSVDVLEHVLNERQKKQLKRYLSCFTWVFQKFVVQDWSV